MQEVNSLCTDSRVHRAEYCTVSLFAMHFSSPGKAICPLRV